LENAMSSEKRVVVRLTGGEVRALMEACERHNKSIMDGRRTKSLRSAAYKLVAAKDQLELFQRRRIQSSQWQRKATWADRHLTRAINALERLREEVRDA
jgi:hypothetical protein